MEYYGIKVRRDGTHKKFVWLMVDGGQIFWAPKVVAEVQIDIYKELSPEMECKLVRFGSRREEKTD